MQYFTNEREKNVFAAIHCQTKFLSQMLIGMHAYKNIHDHLILINWCQFNTKICQTSRTAS